MLTARQQEAYNLVSSGMSIRSAAKQMGICNTTAQAAYKAAEKNLINSLRPPEIPMGSVQAASLCFKADGTQGQSWWKMAFKNESNQMEEFVQGLCEDVRGKGKTRKFKPKKSDRDDMMFEIAIPDAHLGMYAWKDETGGHDYDIDKASLFVLNSVADLCGRCRPAEAHLMIMGDFLHSDNRSGTTEVSKHILDMDTRLSKISRMASETIQQSVEMLAEISPIVHVHVLGGNHDPTAGPWLTLVLEAYFRNCPNVIVDTSVRHRRAIEWGKVMLCIGHGDKIRKGDWSGLIAAEFAEMWGRTKRRYVHLGHFHHRMKMPPLQVEEQTGITVEYLQSLCPIDSYASEHGYVGTLRGAEGFLYTKEGIDTRWPMDR